MERVLMFVRLSLCVLLLFSFSPVTRGARMLSARVQAELPPCEDVPGGIPGWDCFDPPTHDLPPCDYKHQRPGIDCWPKAPPAAEVMTPVRGITYSAAGGASTHDEYAQVVAAARSGGHHIVEGELPPCKDVPGGIPNWDCYDPPSTPLPPCDYEHQNPGIDCSTDSQKPKPPASKSKAATDKEE
ncbi:hypothetical protein M758_4G180100 [Ceratodon purpureus]|nr:hypothetical protein M758_4G180100 [Ceratodon purpureus]